MPGPLHKLSLYKSARWLYYSPSITGAIFNRSNYSHDSSPNGEIHVFSKRNHSIPGSERTKSSNHFFHELPDSVNFTTCIANLQPQCSGGKKFKITTFQLWFEYAEQICPQLHSGYHVPLWTQPKGGPVASCAINEVFNSDANMRLFLEVNSVYVLPSFFNMLFSHLGGV